MHLQEIVCVKVVFGAANQFLLALYSPIQHELLHEVVDLRICS